jgi:hypothetical protein
MRIQVPRRILLQGIVLAMLCALPAVTPSSSFAIPRHDDHDPGTPPPPKGDGDGTIVKARSISAPMQAVTGLTTTQQVASQRTWSTWRMYLSLVRWGFGLHWGGY